MRYRKKANEVEAYRWRGEEVEGFERVCVGKDELGNDHYNLVIRSITGTRYAAEGYWIVRDGNGLDGPITFPYEPSIFERLYEPVVTDWSKATMALERMREQSASHRQVAGDGGWFQLLMALFGGVIGAAFIRWLTTGNAAWLLVLVIIALVAVISMWWGNPNRRR